MPNETTADSDDHVILINPFIVPADALDATVIMWEKARDFLQTQPGYISTALHQALAPNATFQLINIAKWESVEAFQAATKKMQVEGNWPRVKGAIGDPALFSIIRRD